MTRWLFCGDHQPISNAGVQDRPSTANPQDEGTDAIHSNYKAPTMLYFQRNPISSMTPFKCNLHTTIFQVESTPQKNIIYVLWTININMTMIKIRFLPKTWPKGCHLCLGARSSRVRDCLRALEALLPATFPAGSALPATHALAWHRWHPEQSGEAHGQWWCAAVLTSWFQSLDHLDHLDSLDLAGLWVELQAPKSPLRLAVHADPRSLAVPYLRSPKSPRIPRVAELAKEVGSVSIACGRAGLHPLPAVPVEWWYSSPCWGFESLRKSGERSPTYPSSQRHWSMRWQCRPNHLHQDWK